MSDTKVNTKLLGFLQSEDVKSFNERFKPELAGILTNGDPVIIYNERKVSKLSSYNLPLNLMNKDLKKYNFQSCDMKYAKFNNSNCSGVKFEDSVLDFAHFKNSSLTESNLCGCSLVYTNFASCDLQGVNFNHSDIINSVFVKKIITRQPDNTNYVDYEGANLCNFKAINSYLSGIEFKLCDLRKGLLTGSTIKNTTFDSSNLNHTNFSSSVIRNVSFNECYELNDILFENCNINVLSLNKCLFKNCSFSNTLFFELQVNDCIFENCDFYKTQFINSDLSNNNAIFRDCNFHKAIFTESSINFEEEKFIDCNFKESSLNDCELFVENEKEPKAFIPLTLKLINPKISSSCLLNERLEKVQDYLNRASVS